MWVNKQDLDAIAAEQRRVMKAILDDMQRTGERLKKAKTLLGELAT